MDNSIISNQATGFLRVFAFTAVGMKPISQAIVSVYPSGLPTQLLMTMVTNENGQTESLSYPTPPLSYSMEPSTVQPYSELDVRIERDGYETVVVDNVHIFPEEASLLEVSMMPTPSLETPPSELFVIPANTLFGDFPPKIPEDELKTVPGTGEIVLSEAVIPEYVVVHDGPPADRNAENYYVKYKDYIKNVASSEIYATWPEQCLIANILAISSFTLNRVYTEWYRNKGYNFTITTSTAYDQKFVPGRNVFDSISEIVDSVFTNYIARPNISQPLLTQYCDGVRTQCPRFMSQWGSKDLADQGLSAIEILRYYYGNDVYLAEAEEVAGVPISFPGAPLSLGSTGADVRTIQSQLNTISDTYSLIPKLAVDGIYGRNTESAVKTFQKIFGLSQSGVVDRPTWNKISEIYVAVTKIAEL